MRRRSVVSVFCFAWRGVSKRRICEFVEGWDRRWTVHGAEFRECVDRVLTHITMRWELAYMH